MGLEARCLVTYDGQTSEGKALLETSEIIFRGDFRLRIPFKEIASLQAVAGELRIGYGDSTAVFELGANASKWETKILNPRGRLEKLGVKAGARVSVIGVPDESFVAELQELTATIGLGVPLPDSDLVFYEADTLDDLFRLDELRGTIAVKGAVWVVSPKGKGATVKDTDVMAAAREVGLVDTKVVAFSDTHTALKLVIPVKRRATA